MAAPFIVGMNGNGTQAYHAGVLNRDLSRKGEWIIQGGAFNNKSLPASMLDRQAHFPTSLPSDATGALLKILDGGWYDALGQFSLAIDNRFTVTNFTADPQIVLTGGTGGTGSISITGAPRRIGWSLNVTGPFASLTAGQRGLRILPANDAHPERLYSDGTRAMLELTGIAEYRVMEDIQVNEWGDNLQFFGDFGGDTGTPSGRIKVFVQLCNDLNMDLVYAFHPAAPLAHRVAVCVYVAQNLKKGLSFTPELSNEPWNRAFIAFGWLQVKGWERGHYGDGGHGSQVTPIGWENNVVPVFDAAGSQPFLPDYRVNPDDGSEPLKGKTTRAIAAGTTFYGGIYGRGNLMFRAVNNLPLGYVFPHDGDANVTLLADDGALENGKWRYYSEESQALLALASTHWLAAGHSADNLYVALNVQSGPGIAYEDLILSHPDGSFKTKNFEVNQAPYWSTFYGDVGNLTLAKTLDAVAVGDRAQIDERRTWVKTKRAGLQALMPAGRTLSARASGTYEVNHHNGFFGGSDNFTKFKALRRDRRTGLNLKYAMTLFGIENPGSRFRVFNLITGEIDTTKEGWGVFFTQNEALNGPLVNPEGIALKEWNAAAISGVPVADTFYLTEPPAGTATVTAQFGPQVGSAITGVMRASGSRTFDLPFTKAAGAVTADATYTAIAGETLNFTIVPQPGVFTVGTLSGGDGVIVPPVDPPVDPPIDPPVEPPVTPVAPVIPPVSASAPDSHGGCFAVIGAIMAISITICNLALGEIRAPAIADIDEDSLEASTCARYYPQCLKLMLERYEWSFATRISPLAKLACNQRANEWMYAYALPADCATPKRLVPSIMTGGIPLDSRYRTWPTEWGQSFIVEAGVLYTSVDGAILEYSTTMVPEAVMPAMFTDALTYYLAARLAVPLRDSREIKREMLQQAEFAMQRAMADDANRQPQRDIWGIDEVMIARGHG